MGLDIGTGTDAGASTGDVMALYDEMASRYDRVANLTEKKALLIALDYLGVQEGESILEVCAGTGTFLEMLAGSTPAGIIVGADVSRRMASKAGLRLGAVHGRRGRAG